MPIYNKLVRDKIPEIIKADGREPKTRILDEAEYQTELFKKLLEEVNEVVEAKDDNKELMKEIGDVLEVLNAITKTFSLDSNEILKLKSECQQSRGAFDKKIFLESEE